MTPFLFGVIIFIYYILTKALYVILCKKYVKNVKIIKNVKV